MSQSKNISGYVFRKLHSLVGFVPLCFFLAFHLIANGVALFGTEAYLKVIQTMVSIPGLIIIEILVIFLPLLVHGIMGLYIALTGKHNPHKYGYLRNWMFFFQRISGIIIFIFLIWHLMTIKFGGLEAFDMYLTLNAQMHSTLGLILYVATMISVSFHVANGLWGFAINWGILTGMRAQKYFGYICIGLFVVLAIFWFRVMFAFM